MTRLDWRQGLIGRLSMFNPDVASMTDAQRLRARRHVPPRFLSGRPDPAVSTRHVEVPSGTSVLHVRIDVPSAPLVGPRPLLIYIHGGAWMFCDRNTPEWLTTRLATRTGGVVASIDYRLAPEHPFPAALDDCWLALRWLTAQATNLGADPGRIAVIGDSAGGNLAAAVCIMARDHGGPAVVHQTLIYPALDLTLASPSIDTEGHHRIIPRSQLAAIRDIYAGTADLTDWRLSPLHARDLGGLPGAHILVAGHDTLRDDGIRYAERLRAHDVPVRLTSYPGMAHGFLALSLVPKMRRRALVDMVEELSTVTSL